MNRGEVWWAEAPGAGRRPFLILTRQRSVTHLSALVVVPVTRTVRGIPTEVLVGPRDGLPVTSVLSLDNLNRIPKPLFTERICRLGADRMAEVCTALRIATGC